MRTERNFELLASTIRWLAVFLWTGTGIQAATVTSAADIGAGSLRAVVSAAAPGDLIDFNLSVGSVITLTSGQIILNKDLTISGPGAKNLTIQAASGNDRAFEVQKNNGSGVTVSVSRLRFIGGFTGPGGDPGVNNDRTGKAAVPAQGGIFMNDSGCTLIFTNCSFDGCYVMGGTGGLGYGISFSFGRSSSYVGLNTYIANSCVGEGSTPISVSYKYNMP